MLKKLIEAQEDTRPEDILTTYWVRTTRTRSNRRGDQIISGASQALELADLNH